MNEIKRCLICGIPIDSLGNVCMICAEREVQLQEEEGYYEPNPYEDDEWEDDSDYDAYENEWDDDWVESDDEQDDEDQFDLDPVLKQHVYELDLPSLIALSEMTLQLIGEKVRRLLIPSDQDFGDIPF